MVGQLAHGSFFLIGIGIGVLLGGVALATVMTMYMTQSSTSVKTTTSIVTTSTSITTTSSSTTTATLLTTQPAYCGGIALYTLWQSFGSGGITMVIDTSACNFTTTPLYFTSMAGLTNHWALIGYDAIYYATQTSFQVYGQASAYPSSAVLLSQSQAHQWSVNWFALSQ